MRDHGREVKDDGVPLPLFVAALLVIVATVPLLVVLRPVAPVDGWQALALVAGVGMVIADRRRAPTGQGREAQVTMSPAASINVAATLLLPAFVMPVLVLVGVVRRRVRYSTVNAALMLVPVTAAVVAMQLVTWRAPALSGAQAVAVWGLVACVAWWASSGAVMSLLIAWVEKVPLRETRIFTMQRNGILWTQLTLGLVVAVLVRESWWYAPLALLLVWWAYRYVRASRRAVASDVDGKTGLVRYDVLRDAAYAEQEHSARSGEPIALVLLDVDAFREVNAAHGYGAGDAVIVELARRITGSLSWSDVAARVGGEEFCLMLPGTTVPEAEALSERVRALVAATEFRVERASVRLTVSAGVTDLRPYEPLDAALTRLDLALYEAKGAGSNAVRVRLEG